MKHADDIATDRALRQIAYWQCAGLLPIDALQAVGLADYTTNPHCTWSEILPALVKRWREMNQGENNPK